MENEITINNDGIPNANFVFIDITDSNFEREVLQSDKTVMVHFSLESEYDLRIVPTLTELIGQYSSVKFCKIRMAEQTIASTKYGVSLAPTLLIFSFGKVVAQIVGAVPKDTIKMKLDAIIGKPSDELPELTLPELKKAYKQYNGDWNIVFVNGIVAGIVYAIVRSNFTGAATIIVPGLALVFFITNKNLRFSWLQKAIALGLMLIIGTFYKEINELIRQWFFTK